MTKFILNLMLLTTLAIILPSTGFSQCGISGLDSSYCEEDSVVTLIGFPAVGIFSGPGILGNTFDPGLAGQGIHTITYEHFAIGTGAKYYIKSAGSEPWSVTANQTAMEHAFGPGWLMDDFETIDLDMVFAPSTGFIFIDGSDFQAEELEAFLMANLPTIEAWVDAGGRLLLNSAPNEGDNIDFGFGGVVLNYDSLDLDLTHCFDVAGYDLTFPAWNGPLLPTSNPMEGLYFSHGLITGGDCDPILTKLGDLSKVVVAEKCWGAGRVLFGGMTTHNFHTPDTAALNWLANSFIYLYNNRCEGGDVNCSITQEVIVYHTPNLTAHSSETDVCLGDTITIYAWGASTYAWDNGIIDGEPFAPSPTGSYTYNVIGTSEEGCVKDTSISIVVRICDLGETELLSVGIPSAFSPNGDGDNDVLLVKGLGLKSIEFLIYNRYGEVVFESTDQNVGWDGTFKNIAENAGVFTWVLKYEFNNGEKGMKKGNTTLIR